MPGSTINDVAEAAGVSIATVSKALNGTGRVSAATRERVAREAERLGFSPRGRGGTEQIATSPAYSVGVLTSDSFGRFTIPIMLGAEDTLGPGQVAVLMCDSRGDAVRERFYIDSLVRRRVDGIIVTGRNNDPRPPIGRTGSIPVVYAYAPSTDPSDYSIAPDNRRVGALAVEHLMGSGRKRLVQITGPASQTATNDRHLGAAEALSTRGLNWASDPQFGEWSERWGRESAMRLIRDDVEFDGAFCGSDQIARGFETGLRESGVEVPTAVGVVGVDNWDVMAEAARPPLTTIDLNQTEIGRRAAMIIIDAMSGIAVPSGTTLVDPFLVMRESSASRL
ncbi:MAG TPA: LacI family DNA-binding transcriptional regulator [Gryllotalpicola sp.]